MSSSVQICNLALTALGAARIASLSDDTKQARALNAIFDMTRDAELSAHPWTFAIKRASIPASSTAPAFGWTKTYPLPSDSLKLVQVGDSFVFYDSGDTGGLFDVEVGSVLTDQTSPLQIRYVYRVTNSGLFPELFGRALAAKLQYLVAEELTQNVTKKAEALQAYQLSIKEAKRANNIERPPQRVGDLSWVRALTGQE